MLSRRRVLGLITAGSASIPGCAGLSAPRADAPDETTTENGSDDETSSPDDGTSPAVACERTWAGTSVASFEDATGLGRPLSEGDRLFVVSDTGLLALTRELAIDWQQPSVEGGVYGVTEGVVLTSAGDRVVAVDREHGEVAWTFAPPGDHARIAWGPAVHDGTVYVAASQVRTPSTDPDVEYGRLYGLDMEAGSESFVTDLTPTDREWVQPRYLIADAAGVFVTLDEGGLLGAAHDGTVQWRRDGDDWYYRPDRVGSLVLQPRSRSVVAVDTDTGETQWETDAIEMHVAASEGVVYGAGRGGPDTDGTLAAIDGDSGESTWETTIQGCGSRPVIGSGTLAIPVGCRADAGHVGLFDTATGCRYGAYTRSADLTPGLATGDGRLYASVGENMGQLLAFELP